MDSDVVYAAFNRNEKSGKVPVESVQHGSFSKLKPAGKSGPVVLVG
jgi:hypothetical protein